MKKREVVAFYLMATALMSANAVTYQSRASMPDMSLPVSTLLHQTTENAEAMLPSSPHLWAAIRPASQPANAKPSHDIVADVLVLTQLQ